MSADQAAPGGRLGELVRQHRQASGLSQEELAEMSGLSVRTIANIEHGRICRPHLRSVRALADAFGLPAPERDRLQRASRLRPDDQLAPAVVPSAVVPRQLPAALLQFAGRSDELAALTSMLGARGAKTLMISAIGGTAGVGKTALALHWAHQVADRFPDGQLYANLRGFGPSGMPVRPAEALRGFLDALGVPPARIPAAVDGQAALYRSLLARRSMLILLDNAHDAEQVRPLLPASPSSVVVVTSRRHLVGLVAADGARPLHLDVLTTADAMELLARRLGRDRIAAEPQAALDLVALSARLPLGLAIVAGRAAASPALTLSDLAADLRAANLRLDALDTGEAATSLRAVLSWSYEDLRAPAARMFRLLGLHPGPDVSIGAAASLTGMARNQARRALADLAAAQVLTEHAPGRFAFHDLLRAYAAEQATCHDSPAERQDAIGRMLDHYLHSVHHAALAIDPARDSFALPASRPGTEPELPRGLEGALEWLRAELPVLLAAARLAAEVRLDSYAWQIPLALSDYLDRQGHWAQGLDAFDTAVAAARRLGDSSAQARMLRYLGEAKARLGRDDEAYRDLSNALTISEDLSDPLMQAVCHGDISWVFELKGNITASLRHARLALALFRRAGHRRWEAGALNRLGWYQAHSGSYAEALASCQQALEICAELDDRHNRAEALDSVGYAHYHLGDHDLAVTCYTEALGIVAELSEPYNHAVVLDHLGDAHAAGGDLEQARGDWEQALAMLDELNHPLADQVRGKMARLGQQVGSDSR